MPVGEERDSHMVKTFVDKPCEHLEEARLEAHRTMARRLQRVFSRLKDWHEERCEPNLWGVTGIDAVIEEVAE